MKGFVSVLLVHYFFTVSRSSLVVNVKTKRGDITQEEIDADPEKDLITMDYKLNDGQYVNMLIDFQKVYLQGYIIFNTFVIASLLYASSFLKLDAVFCLFRYIDPPSLLPRCVFVGLFVI